MDAAIMKRRSFLTGILAAATAPAIVSAANIMQVRSRWISETRALKIPMVEAPEIVAENIGFGAAPVKPEGGIVIIDDYREPVFNNDALWIERWRAVLKPGLEKVFSDQHFSGTIPDV